MTATLAVTTSPAPRTRLVGRVRDVLVLTRRNLIHIAREPLQLSDVTVQPVLFTLLFIYVFGSAVPLHGGYKQFALAGLMALNLTTSSIGTAVGLSTDLESGAVDRFRTLPMWGAAVLVGRSLSDALSSTLCIAIVAVTGLAIGWRPDANALSVLGGFGIAILFSYALAWGCSCLGMISKGPESAQGTGLIILFPLAIVSNAMVPTNGMPAWLRTVANWNPVSAVTGSIRNLFGNPNPSAALHAWPAQHATIAAVIWSLGLLAVFAPLAVWLFRRRTTD